MFRLETKDDAETKALTTENLTCPITGVIYRMEEFRTPISVQQCWNSQGFGDSAITCRSKKNALSVGRAIIIKEAQIKKKQPKCDSCQGPRCILQGCPAYEKQQATYGGQPKICLTSTPKLGSPTAPG